MSSGWRLFLCRLQISSWIRSASEQILKSTLAIRDPTLINAACAEHLPQSDMIFIKRHLKFRLAQSSENTVRISESVQVKILFVQVCCFPSVWAEGGALKAPQPPLVVIYSHNYWCLWCNLLTILLPEQLLYHSFVLFSWLRWDFVTRWIKLVLVFSWSQCLSSLICFHKEIIMWEWLIKVILDFLRIFSNLF